MIAKYISKPLGVDSAPIGISKPLIGAAALIAGAGLIGSIVNSQNQSDANYANQRMNAQNNETQIRLAREANEMSQAQFDQNMKWLREQYYDKDYMRRAREAYQMAGLNPALAYGSPQHIGSVGAPSQSQFHVAQTEAGHVDPVHYGDALSESVGHAVDAYMNNQLINAQTENINQDSASKRIQNFTQFARDIANLRSTYADIELKLSQKGVSEAEREKLELEKEDLDNRIKQFWSEFDDVVNNKKKSNRLLDAQADEAESRAELNRIEARLRPALAAANIRLSNAQSKSLLEHLRLIEPTINNLVAEGKLTDAKSIGEYLANGESALNFLKQNHLNDLYEGNKVTRKGRDFFYMLGDLFFNSLSNLRFK